MAQKHHLDNPDIATGFKAVQPHLPGAGLDWLDGLRQAAMTRFQDQGIPGPRLEDWKYTNLTFLAAENFAPHVGVATETNAEVQSLFETAFQPDIAGPVVVFVNGIYHRGLSAAMPEIQIRLFSESPADFRPLLQEKDEQTPLNRLNQALMTDGYHLAIAAGVTLNQPIQVIHIATHHMDRKALHNRAYITLAQGAKARLIECFVGPDQTRYWHHMVTHVTLDEDASLDLHQIQCQGQDAIHISELHTRLAEKARFNQSQLQIGAGISRSEAVHRLAGPYGHVTLSGVALGRDQQAHDIVTRIHHDHPHGQSDQIFRAVVDDNASAAFQGKIVVAQDAQKTNANQSSKNLLLSRKAQAHSKPELLIYADDVKCSHGATVGALDPEQLFYMQSRGLDAQSAKSLLIQAFVAEALANIAPENLAQILQDQAAGWLQESPLS